MYILKNLMSLLPKNKLISTMSIFKHCIGEACWKYFVGYVNHFNNETEPVLTRLSKLSGSVKSFEKVKLYYLCLKKTKIY